MKPKPWRMADGSPFPFRFLSAHDGSISYVPSREVAVDYYLGVEKLSHMEGFKRPIMQAWKRGRGYVNVNRP